MDEAGCASAAAAVFAAADRADRGAVVGALVELRRCADPVSLAVVLTSAVAALHGGSMSPRLAASLALEVNRRVRVWAPELADPAAFDAAIAASCGDLGASRRVEFPTLVFALIGVLWCLTGGWTDSQRVVLVTQAAVGSRASRASLSDPTAAWAR